MTHNPPARVIGRYVLCDLIASGGMAAVHLGRFIGVQEFSRIVAIKQLHEHYAGDREFVAMLFDEARLLARIRHTNVVAPLDVELCGSELFIVMEYVHAESLSRVLRSAGSPVPPSIACAVMCQVLSGLHAAHEARGPRGQSLNIVHRDVSPQNILIMEDGTVKIVDFGIAKAGWRMHTTSCGTLKGKRSYMAPEQFRGLEVDRRTDVFSAGVVLWEMLTGKRLFTGDAPALIEQQVMSGQVTAPSKLVSGLPAELDAIALRAMSLDPADRFPDAHAMAAALASVGPLANMLEVGGWVSRHVGDALRTRAARILELESVPLEEMTLPLPASGPAHPAPIAFTSSTLPTVREKPSAPKPRRLAHVASAVTLAAAAVILLLAQQHQDAKPALARAIAPSRIATNTASALSSAAPKRVGDGAAPLGNPTAPTTTADTPRAAEPASRVAPPVARRAEPTLARKPSVSLRNEPAGAPSIEPPAPAPVATAEPTPAPTLPQPTASSSASCNPPYWVDKDGFKRFKLECVTPSTRP